MKQLWIWILLGVLAVGGVAAWLIVPQWAFAPTDSEVPDGFRREASPLSQAAPADNGEDAEIAVVAQDLEVPWAIDWLPNGAMLVTERPGRIQYFFEGRKQEITVPGVVRQVGEGGLLGLAVHPDFITKPWVYLYRTTGGGGGTVNTVERFRLTEDLELVEQVVLLGGIPGAAYHDGGALAFGPDGYLYITTGDAGQEALAQNRDSLAGKILRITEDGEIPEDNPFGTAVWSWGHRNPQGLAWDDSGELWATEHGRSGVQSGLDELNIIEAGNNYGWPTIEGDERQEGLVGPVRHSGANDTWAPAGAAWWEGSLFFAGLRGQSLYEAQVNGNDVALQAHLRGQLGRMRAVAVGPDGALYVSTSNQDGRGEVQTGDDKILRIPPGVL